MVGSLYVGAGRHKGKSYLHMLEHEKYYCSWVVRAVNPVDASRSSAGGSSRKGSSLSSLVVELQFRPRLHVRNRLVRHNLLVLAVAHPHRLNINEPRA